MFKTGDRVIVTQEGLEYDYAQKPERGYVYTVIKPEPTWSQDEGIVLKHPDYPEGIWFQSRHFVLARSRPRFKDSVIP